MFGFVQLLPETEVILDYAREAGYVVILITDRLVFPRSYDADIVLYAGRGEVWEFHSMVGPTYIIENLILGVGLLSKGTVCASWISFSCCVPGTAVSFPGAEPVEPELRADIPVRLVSLDTSHAITPDATLKV